MDETERGSIRSKSMEEIYTHTWLFAAMLIRGFDCMIFDNFSNWYELSGKWMSVQYHEICSTFKHNGNDDVDNGDNNKH